LLRAGENVLHARTHTTSYPVNVEGLGRITFGDARPVRRISVQHVYAGFYAGVFFLAMAFAAGLITLFAWLAYRTDRIMFWFSLTCLSWALVGMLNHAVRWMDLGLLNPVLSLYVNYGLVVPAIILCLRTAGLRWRRIELVLWLFLAVQVTYPWWLDRANLFVRLGWDIVNTGLLLGGVAILLIAAKRPLGWPYRLEVSALFFMAVLMSFEVIRYLGWIDPETVSFRQYHVPVMLLAIGAAIFERHVAAIWRMQDTKAELERRVAEKTREIEANHLRVQEAMREQTLARERQRILADMHDGLGATLVSLLRHVQAGGSTTGSIEQRAREALHELRIAVDALQPNEGDIASVIGSIRSRLDELVQATGVRLEWCVDEMPMVAGLNPSTVFALQRIMLEAVTNALKHSGARTIRLLATAPDNEKVVIEIRDDGRGFESPESATGFGIANMRARSTAAGAQLQIASHPNTGTVIRLTLPLKRHLETPALQSTEQPPLGLNPARSVL
jgi:signal transduction histidine kinase